MKWSHLTPCTCVPPSCVDDVICIWAASFLDWLSGSFRPASLPLCSFSPGKDFLYCYKMKRELLEGAQASTFRLVCEEEEGRGCSAPMWSPLKWHCGLFLTKAFYVILCDAIMKSHLFAQRVFLFMWPLSGVVFHPVSIILSFPSIILTASGS